MNTQEVPRLSTQEVPKSWGQCDNGVPSPLQGWPMARPKMASPTPPSYMAMVRGTGWTWAHDLM